MADVTVKPKLKLPRITRVTLHRFSLYSSQPTISAEINNGVFCLAGANGLGKSTFLAAVNYAITGMVADPDRKYESVEEYYKHSLGYSSTYFTGRITDLDRDIAEVRVEFDVGNNHYHITRSVFEPLELRFFSITNRNDNSIVFSSETNDLAPGALHSLYTSEVTKDVELDSFEQLAFLQHFLLTFDERRELLFWNHNVLEQVLYIAFAVDQKEAGKADTLRRDIEKADSLARNANWQATQIRRQIEEIEKRSRSGATNDEDTEAVGQEHNRLLAELDGLRDRLASAIAQFREAELQLTKYSASYSSLRLQYDAEFAKFMAGGSEIARHPLIVSSVKDCTCGLCGRSAVDVPEAIQSQISGNLCPLCRSSLAKQEISGEAVEKLAKIDSDMSKLKVQQDEATKRLERVGNEKTGLQLLILESEKKLEDFEQANESAIDRLRGTTTPKDGVDVVIASYRKQMEDCLRTKEAQYRKRNEKKIQLAELHSKLEVRYSDAEKYFVPGFRELAFSFLGIDLDVRMQRRTAIAPGLQLDLEVKGTVRSQHHQLSESQRFFVDIALRMALVKFMSDVEAKGSLFIDTPEGSLDIAYEGRAGDMFAQFVEDGYHILMTANINTSRILLALAERLGREDMQLCQMTNWTELSEVQIAGLERFQQAYADIEKAMDSKGGAPTHA